MFCMPPWCPREDGASFQSERSLMMNRLGQGKGEREKDLKQKRQEWG